MSRCENCIHNKVCDEWAVSSGLPFVNADTCEHFKPTADVAPKSEEEKPMFENTKHILLYLKRDIHSKATYPDSQGISPYISLKVLDAILQGYLNKLE